MCAPPVSALRLEQRRALGLRDTGSDVSEERHVRERDPAALRARIDVEMLVLDAARLDRQEQKVAGLPVNALAVDHGIALAGDHIDHEPALVPMLAGLGLEIVREHAP